MVPPPTFLQRAPSLTVDGFWGSHGPCSIGSFVRHGFLLFVVQADGVAKLEDFSAEVEGGWLPTVGMVQFSPLTAGMLEEVVRQKNVTARSLDGWGGGSLKLSSTCSATCRICGGGGGLA